jgi:uncharacterized protein YbjT (DUF2867 family)
MILVTGPTGAIGTELVKQLLESGEKFRVLVRDPSKVAFLQGKAEIAQGDLKKPETLKPAMQGIDHLFLLTIDQETSSDLNVLNAAKAAGKPHVVKISTNFVENQAQAGVGVWHAEKEKVLKESGLAWTMLRPDAFMSNTLRWAGTVKGQGAVYYATGAGKTCQIDPYDIAAAAKAALTQAGHEGKAYDLTGPEKVSTAEQIEILGKVLGKALKAVEVSVEIAVENMLRVRPDMSPRLVEAQKLMLSAIRDGQYARQPTDAVQKLSGRAPRSYQTWCEAHKAAFI